MSDPHSTPPDALVALIRAGGRREAPPEWAYERVLSAMTEAWRAKLHARRRRLIAAMAAGIAALVLGLGIVTHSLLWPPRVVASVADVERVIGSVRVRVPESSAWTSLQENTALLPEGTLVRSEAGSAAALRIRDVSVRVAERSDLLIESEARLQLARGKIYIDTGDHVAARGVLVVAGATTVTDVGTQFEVQYRDDDCRVRVREGTVLLQRGALRRRGVAGEQISIDASGFVSRAAISSHDPDWRWIRPLANAPDIDEQPLTVLLAWVARESGVKVRYATPAIERKATTTILHGSIQRLEPFEALEVMLATTDLRHEVLADGTILIK
jgi:FecR protein